MPSDGLRYHATPTGYVLYSIGPDLKDNLGASLKDKQGDIAYVVANFSDHK
jgi:hypothetical protein